MRNKYLVLALCGAMVSLWPSAAGAAPVTVGDAGTVAANFWNLHRDGNVAAVEGAMQCVKVPWDAFFIFEPHDMPGFVIVAADDCVQPVLAYSFANPIGATRMSPELVWWLDGWQQQIDLCRSKDYEAPGDVADQWRDLLAGGGEPRRLTVVAPMLTTKWDQEAPYNNACPTLSLFGSPVHAATGCVATAMAQVMKYWNYPQRGTGTQSYYSYSMTGYGQEAGRQTVDFGATVYDWHNMPNVLTSASSTVQKNAVAMLMYHCGVACEMQYGTSYDGGSGAWAHNIPLLSMGSALSGMVRYFGYSSAASGVYREKYGDSAWMAMVRAELDAQRPVIYVGGDETSGAHCFVCDGYDDQGRFDFNWGWSGIGDGYYTLDNLAPGDGGVGGGTGLYDFSNNQQMLVGIRPHTGDDSLCVIRHFPYTEAFEDAPTCWSATMTDDYSYSWMVYDTTGTDGNYSVYAGTPYSGSGDNHLLSPAIVEAGAYTVTWKVRAMNEGVAAYYTLNAGQAAMSDTVSVSAWVQRELAFTVDNGDTVMLDFGYTGRPGVGGLLLDSVVVSSTMVLGVEGVPDVRISVWPNPANGIVNVEASQPVRLVEVIDLAGRKVCSANGAAVDLGGMPAGVYILRCTTDGGVATSRVVKR